MTMTPSANDHQTTLTLVIADDEKPARDKLKRQLSLCDGFTIIGEAEDGAQAVDLIHQLKPDIALLDINMPELSGLDVLDVLHHHCQIIFSTAYDQFAIQAFEKAAIDYLLKPYSLDRLKQALARTHTSLSATSTNARTTETKISASASPDTMNSITAASVICSKQGERVRVLNLADIAVFTTSDGETLAHTLRGSFPIEQTLEQLESSLPAPYIRVHRGTIINLNHIDELQRWFNGNYLILLKPAFIDALGEAVGHITTSRTGSQKLRQALKL